MPEFEEIYALFLVKFPHFTQCLENSVDHQNHLRFYRLAA